MVNEDYSFCTPYLTEGEQILWKGNAQQGNMLTLYDLCVIPFSIFWTGFVVFMGYQVLSSGQFVFALFLIPFLAVGLYMMFGRFILTKQLRKHTFYVITSKKIIRKRGNRVRTVNIFSFSQMKKRVCRDTNGYIMFLTNFRAFSFACYIPTDPQIPDGMGVGYFVLENIPEVERVEKILTDLRTPKD